MRWHRSSGASIGAVTVRGKKKRNMIVTGRIGNTETKYHVIEKRRIRQFQSTSLKIIPRKEFQFVDTRNELVAGKRLQGAPILICYGLFDHLPRIAVHTVK